MMRIAPWVTGFVVASMAFSACTCRSCGNGPEEEEARLAARAKPTKPAQRSGGGFDPGLSTSRNERPFAGDAGRSIDLPTVPPTAPVTLAPTVPEEVELPEDFPSDVPLPEKDAKPVAVKKLPQNAKSVFFNSDKPAEQIFAHYQSEMQRGEWKKEQEYQTPHQSYLQFKKGKQIMQMTISTDPKTGKRLVQIMYQDEQDLPFPEF